MLRDAGATIMDALSEADATMVDCSQLSAGTIGQQTNAVREMTTRYKDEELMAYVDGEVDDESRRAIRAAADFDPEVVRTMNMFAQTRAMARAAFSCVLPKRRCGTEPCSACNCISLRFLT
jgi:hypothetical protein